MSKIETKSKTAEIERKSMGCSIKSFDDEKNIVEGYASTFGGAPDAYDDVVAKGAFAKTIRERGDRIKFLFGHSWDSILGKVTDIYEDDHGLYFKAKISETEKGKEVMQLIKDGVIDRLSIGYGTVKSDYDAVGIRTLREVKLYEISAVGIPANDNAMITGAKSEKSVEEVSVAIKKIVSDTLHAFDGLKNEMKKIVEDLDLPEDEEKENELTDEDKKDIADMVSELKELANRSK